jgi:hypothetical protein
MRRYLRIKLIVIVILLVHVGCLDFPGMTEVPDWHSIPVHIRNMSTSSGFILTLPDWIYQGGYMYGGFSVSLDPSPEPGMPVEASALPWGPHTFDCSLRRTIDSMVVISGSVHIASETWVLIEEDNDEWSCTWSNSGW